MSERGLTVGEWAEKEKYYEEQIRDIVITPNISENDIKVLISKLDRVYTNAYFDFARAKTAYERVQRQNKTLAKSLYLDAKQGRITELGARPSDETCKAWAETKLAEKPDESIPSPMWLEEQTSARYNFMQAVMGILNDKRQMLITDQAVLKLEASLQQ